MNTIRIYTGFAIFAIFLLCCLLVVSCSEDNPTGTVNDFTQIAFIYQPDSNHKNEVDFKTFLGGRGYAFTEIAMENITITDFSPYELIIIDSWIGSGDDWGSVIQGNTIINTELPVLGIGFGGARFFNELGLSIGWDNGQYFPDSTSQSVLNTQSCIADGRININHEIFTSPNAISIIEDTLMDVYHHTAIIGIDRDNGLADTVTYFGRRPGFGTQYSLIMEGSKFFLWGYTNSPGSMNPGGRDLFVNIVEYLAIEK